MIKILVVAASFLLAAIASPLPSRADSSGAARVQPSASRAGQPAPSSLPLKAPDGRAALASAVVNLNEANPEQLALLPGVGPSRAAAIVAYRKQHPFKRLEELTRVKGFGRKSYSRLRPLLSLSGPTTLRERPHSAAAQPARPSRPLDEN